LLRPDERKIRKPAIQIANRSIAVRISATILRIRAAVTNSDMPRKTGIDTSG
jgi:hypothetical protein